MIGLEGTVARYNDIPINRVFERCNMPIQATVVHHRHRVVNLRLHYGLTGRYWVTSVVPYVIS